MSDTVSSVLYPARSIAPDFMIWFLVSGLLFADVIGRVVSRLWTIAANSLAILKALVSVCSCISLPMLHIITHGWLRSRFIWSSRSREYQWQKNKPFAAKGNCIKNTNVQPAHLCRGSRKLKKDILATETQRYRVTLWTSASPILRGYFHSTQVHKKCFTISS